MPQPHAPIPADPLQTAFEAFVDAHAMLASGHSVVVAVSGGADSVALLSLLRAMAADLMKNESQRD